MDNTCGHREWLCRGIEGASHPHQPTLIAQQPKVQPNTQGMRPEEKLTPSSTEAKPRKILCSLSSWRGVSAIFTGLETPARTWTAPKAWAEVEESQWEGEMLMERTERLWAQQGCTYQSQNFNPMVKIHIFPVYSRAAAAICQIQAHIRPRHFHKAGMTQSQVLLLPILVPNRAPRVPLGVTKKPQPSLTPNRAKMGHILLRDSEVYLQTKLHQLSPPLLPSLILVSNNRNLFPDWNRVRKKSKFKDCMDKRGESRCLWQGYCSTPRCTSLEIRTGRIPLHVSLAVFQKLNTITWAAQSTQSFLHFTEHLSFLFFNWFWTASISVWAR